MTLMCWYYFRDILNNGIEKPVHKDWDRDNHTVPSYPWICKHPWGETMPKPIESSHSHWVWSSPMCYIKLINWTISVKDMWLVMAWLMLLKNIWCLQSKEKTYPLNRSMSTNLINMLRTTHQFNQCFHLLTVFGMGI